MKISDTLQPLLDASRREVPSLLQQLKVGQVLPGRVIERLQPGLLTLELASTRLLARSQVDIAPGTRLRLEVVKDQPVPQLRVLRPAPAVTDRQLLVRSAMPRQQAPREVRQAVDDLRPQATTPAKAEAVQRLSAILNDAGVALERLSPTQVRRALRHSGLFHEARLAAGGTAEPGDSKARLLRLLSLLQREPAATHGPGRSVPAGPEQASPGREPGGDALLQRLIRVIEASLSRIQLQQAAALPAEDGPRQAWQIDLPIHLAGETREAMLRIERETPGVRPGDAPSWTVNLVFDFDTIGTLECRIALAGERLSTTFWCAKTVTQQDLEQRLPGLKAALEAQGLEVVHLAGVVGTLPQSAVRLPVPDTLVDEHA